MIKRIVALCILGLMVLSIGSIPSLLLKSIPEREYTYPREQVYQKTISAIGKFQDNYYREIYIESPIIADQVNVSVGDRVNKGDVIASIDTELTKNVLQSSVSVKMQSVGQNWDEEKMGKVAQAYGLSDKMLSELLGNDSGVSAVNDYDKQVVPLKIYAPISGVVTAMNLSDHVLTQSNKPIAAIAENTTMKVLLEVSENDIQYVEEGSIVNITTEAAINHNYTGKITKIYPSTEQTEYGDTQETVVKVEVLIDNPDGNVKSGFSAKGKICVEEAKTIVTIPYEAILQDEQNQEYVYVWKDGRAARQDITTGLELTYSVEVLQGLNGEEKVILEPSGILEKEVVRLRGEYYVS